MAKSSKISIKDIFHIAKLVNLSITEPEASALAPQLSQAASYVEVLEELNLDQIAQTSQVTNLKNIFRPDEIKPSLTQAQALSQAKNTRDGYFVVPVVIRKK